MKLHIKNVNLSRESKEAKHILIENGIYKYISDAEIPKDRLTDFETFDAKGLVFFPGFCDIGTYSGEPGHENRENFKTLSSAALAGGFTDLAIQPETKPIIDNASSAAHILNLSEKLDIHIHPLGAASTQLDRKNIAEFRDMHEAGVRGFTQTFQKTFPADLLIRTMEYTRAFDGLTITHPADYSLVTGGQMNEGKVSTELGLRGFPSFVELMTIERDLHIARYTEGKLHFAGISCAGSVELIRKAKAEGLPITASVSINNLVFDDSQLYDYDSNFKMLPPLRSEEDRNALIAGVVDGTIDIIISRHEAWDTEAKDLEFPYAEYGVIGLQTLLSAWNEYLKEDIGEDILSKVLSVNPRKLLNLAEIEVKEGAQASFSLFDSSAEWTMNSSENKSKNNNSPFWGKKMKGKVIYVCSKGKIFRF